MSQDRTTEADPFAAQIPAYALGALDAEETARLDAHLATCPTCPAELAAFEAVASALALSLDPAPEPAGHQERFQQKLDAADSVAEPPGHRGRFLEKLNAETVRTGEELPPPAPPPLVAPPRPQPAPTVRRPWWQGLNPAAGWALAGTLALLLLLAGLWGFDAQQRATATAQQAQGTATQA